MAFKCQPHADLCMSKLAALFIAFATIFAARAPVTIDIGKHLASILDAGDTTIGNRINVVHFHFDNHEFSLYRFIFSI